MIVLSHNLFDPSGDSGQFFIYGKQMRTLPAAGVEV